MNIKDLLSPGNVGDSGYVCQHVERTCTEIYKNLVTVSLVEVKQV